MSGRVLFFRRAIVVVIVGGALARAQVPLPGSEGKLPLRWAADHAAALKTAEQEKKPVLMDVTTDWCGWSKKMDRETFAAASVQAFLTNCVLLRLNPESSDHNRELAMEYGVDSYPTLIVLNYRGEALAQKTSFLDAEKCAKFLGAALAGFNHHPPLGYLPVALREDDPLLKAVAKMPATESLPATADSIILLDQSTLTVDKDGVARQLDRRASFAVDPDRGALRSVTQTYNASRGAAKLQAVRILDRQGRGRALDVALAEDENIYSGENVHWDVRQISLEIPPLKAGQILDVVEEIEERPVMPGHFAFKWITNLKYIVIGDLSLTFPANLSVEKHPVRNQTPVTVTTNADGTVTWRLLTNNLEWQEPELFAPSPVEEWQGYLYCTATKWDEVAKWFQSLCAGQDELPAEAKAKVAALKRQYPKAEDLLQAIFAWITKDIRYVSVVLGMSSHQPHPVAQTLQNKYGDCKDQALLLHALCREAGISSALVLLGAGCDRPVEPPAPTVTAFDHCILEARVGDQRYYLDPSSGAAQLGWLPVQCTGAQALRIEPGGGATLITLPPYRPQESSREHKSVKLNRNGSATVTEVKELTGPLVHAAKLRMKGVNLLKMRKQMEDALRPAGQKLLEFSVTDPNSDSDRYQLRVAYTMPRYASPAKNGLVFKLVDNENDGNWVSALEMPRTHPFRFYPTDIETKIHEVELPAGATLDSPPKNLEITNSFLQVTRTVTVNANRLTVNEKSALRNARLPASASADVAAAMRRLEDHRAHAFIVTLPAAPATP